MKNHLLLSEEEENGGPRSVFLWWRACEEFDESGHLKVGIESNLSNLTPRIKVLREMERLALISAEGLHELKHKLLGYKAGDFWLPIGGLKKQDMDIPPTVTILLLGLTNSGKSSFINLMCSVLGRSGLIPFAQTSSGGSSNHTTMYLEEHNVLRSPRSGFCVYDTRGLDQDRMEEGLDEVSTWMLDGVVHKQPCFRPGNGMANGVGVLTNSMYVKRKVNSVMVVADLSQIVKAFNCGELKSLEALKDLFYLSTLRNSNENPMLILTHGDSLNGEDRINGRLRICEYLGIAETSGAYDVACLTEQGIEAEEYDPVTAFALTEAVYRAVLQCDRTHVPKMQLKDWAVLFFSWIMWCLASFFAILANFFAQFGDHDKKL